MSGGTGPEQPGGATEPRRDASQVPTPLLWLLVYAAFAGLCLLLYRDALHGPFLSDDIGYIATNPYTRALSAGNLAAIFDPWGPAKLYTANYAPVHLLLTALERHMFADAVFGYHLVGVLVHAANATLLVALLSASGAPALAAGLGGLVFAVHPANVEAVAWISQLKTTGALAFAFLALLALRGRPLVSVPLFALALLTKFSAAFALPMGIALALTLPGDAVGPRRWGSLAAWAVVLALVAIPQFASFAQVGEVVIPEFDDPWVHLRSVAGIGARYLVMAPTAIGVSAFQEPAPAVSALDPWWLAALPLGGLLAWRAIVTLSQGREEAAWWIGAAAAFAPVSQVFPFLIPVADRYLYFILPGLIGGVWLMALAASERSAHRKPFRRAAALIVFALVASFGVQSAGRAALWRSEITLLMDAAKHYPDGGTAYYLRARRLALAGETEAAVASLRTATERGIDRFMALENDPGFAAIRDTPAFRELIRDVAGRFLERAGQRGTVTQPMLRIMAHAHMARGELDEAAARFEQALRVGGPMDAIVRAELMRVNADRSRTARDGPDREGARDLPQNP